MHRAYSLLDVKSVDDGKRIFTGMATTPSLDRMNDRVDPMKAIFAKEIPLLHAHKHDMPIGVVRLGQPNKAGIPFEAEIPVIHEPQTLKERVDTAYAEIKHGLVRAVSIGFLPKDAPTLNKDGGLDYNEVEIYELSTVVIPAQAGALINTIKSYDDAAMRDAGISSEIPASPEVAASGKSLPVVKLDDDVRVRTQPFVIRNIRTK